MTNNTLPKLHQFVSAWLMLLLGIYINAGLIVAAVTADWPPFWPSIDRMTQPLEMIAIPKTVIFYAIIIGGLVIFVGVVLLIIGLYRVVKNWKMLKHFIS